MIAKLSVNILRLYMNLIYEDFFYLFEGQLVTKKKAHAPAHDVPPIDALARVAGIIDASAYETRRGAAASWDALITGRNIFLASSIWFSGPKNVEHATAILTI